MVDYYRQTLKDSPEALAYLEQRGLTHPEVIEHFKLGLANRTLGLRLPDKFRKAGADIRAKLQRVGLFRDSGHEHFTGSLIVPVLDTSGQVRELYGRKITRTLRPGTPLHLYLPVNASRGRDVFNVDALKAARAVASGAARATWARLHHKRCHHMRHSSSCFTRRSVASTVCASVMLPDRSTSTKRLLNL